MRELEQIKELVEELHPTPAICGTPVANASLLIQQLEGYDRSLYTGYLALFEETRQTTVFITSELEEALFLADKIYIMGGQPTQIVDIIDVDLPRPRNFEVTVSKEYLAYKEKAIHRLFESEEK